MAKYVVAEPRVQIPVDWTKCIICQNNTAEKLQCPADSKRADNLAGYKSFANILPEFSQANLLPAGFDLQRLDDGNGIFETLSSRHAKWHKSCRLFFYKTQLDRAAKRACDTESVDSEQSSSDSSTSKRTMYRRSMSSDTRKSSVVYKEPVCFICDNCESTDALHAVTTLRVDEKVRECAAILGDAVLLAKLSDGDLVSQEAKYHQKCLKNLYYSKEQHVREGPEKMESNACFSSCHSIAWAQLLSYIDETRCDCATAPVFKLSDLASMYSERLSQLSCDKLSEATSNVNRTRLKELLLSHYPNLRAQVEGRNVLLVFDSDIGPALRKACQADCDEDALHLTKAAEIVRRDIFNAAQQFSGSFDDNCQESAIPANLLALVAMILEGPSITNQNRGSKVPAALSISQLLVFNSVKHKRRVESVSTIPDCRRSRTQETPLPLYVGLLLHATTRKRSLVDRLSHLGLCVSYDRVLDLSADIANTVCDQYTSSEVVCPPSLVNHTFTVGAVDNIDHNLSSTTAQSSFHGTAISLMQQPDSANNSQKEAICLIGKSATDSRRVHDLPASYANVPPVKLITEQPSISGIGGPTKRVEIALNNADNKWLDNVMQVIDFNAHNPHENSEWISWSTFHAAHAQSSITLSNIAMLPLFQESSNSVSMIKHSFDVVMKAVHFLNPGQTPVVALDQPLYAIGKTIQWNWPNIYGEDKLVVVMGGLHIEIAALKTLGALLKDSGWVQAISSAGITTSGTAEALLSASHVRRCRHVHEVTCCVLHILQYRAYQQLHTSVLDDDQTPMPFSSWCDQQMSRPQFAYWSLVKELQLILFRFVRSIRSSDFDLYLDSLTRLAPFFFSLDRTHYARWVSVHIQDMACLSDSSPSTYTEFMAGKFTVKKSCSKFSAMAIDQAHEQCNAAVKGDGGIIGLTDNEDAMRRWAVAGPEVARLIQEFEAHHDSAAESDHHEHSHSTQKTFRCEINSLLDTITEMGNPFVEESEDLIVLHSRLVATTCGISDILSIKSLGQSQYDEFVEKRLVEKSLSVFAPLKRNKLTPFGVCRSTAVNKSKQLLKTTKTDCALFSRLYIGCQSRDGNLETFFSHENQPYPPSISEYGTLRFGVKADLLQCLEHLGDQPHISDPTVIESAPAVDMIALDGAVAVQMLKPGKAKTFREYASDIFLPYVAKQLNRVQRLDLVWDTYNADSLKSTARSKRGIGSRIHVGPNVPIPHKWSEFLRVDENKADFFRFLSEQSVNLPVDESKLIVVTLGPDIASSSSITSSPIAISPCNQEEADTRLILHAYHAASAGYKKISIRTVDTDVLVLAVSFRDRIACDELWISFGTGKHFRYIPVHEIAKSLGPQKSRALLAFHSFTGCDTTSAFHGKGKKTAWETWATFPPVSDALAALLDCPTTVSDETLSLLERFTILMYDRTSNHTDINAARQTLFTRGLQIAKIPPTKNALVQHVRRAAYQAGHVWSQALTAECALPNPGDWGWSSDTDGWTPLWTTIPDADKCCLELLKCGCKTGCITRRCKCVRANLKCTALCSCDGECNSAD